MINTSRRNRSRLRIGAGVLTWCIVSALAFYILLLADRELGLFTVLALANLAGMLLACARDEQLSLAARRLAHGVELASALVAGWFVHIDFLPIYTIIWIAIASGLYAEKTQWWLLGAVISAWYVIMDLSWGYDRPLITVALYGTFHLFALLMARTADQAELARDRAEFLNSELIATQHLLSEASRQSERTRIARDLHDLLGHHLTALSINLQTAERLADGPARDKIAESRALARLLLSDVREAVSTLREESSVDFERSIALLVDKVPQLEVDLDIESGLAIAEVDVAESLLRCVQEALTNTLRHAGASRSWIKLWRENDSVHLEIRDDGNKAANIQDGNGLMGMRERLAPLKGNLNLEQVDNALTLHVTIPLAPG